MSITSLSRAFCIVTVLCFIGCFSYGQKTEIRVNAYSGVFSFRGNGSSTYSAVYVADVLGYYNRSSYGRMSDFSYSAEFQLQKVTKKKQLLGVGLGFEKLTSKAAIDSIYGDMGGFPATGKVKMANTFITVNPYIGRRFVAKSIVFDVAAGIDLAFCIKVLEKAKITSNLPWLNTLNKTNYPFDIRPRIQVSAYYQRVGLLAGYSLGTNNFYSYSSPFRENRKAFENFLRLGISYQLK